MKIYAPSYYNRFCCIASACRHSCCRGWEIDIDAASVERYRSMGGMLGKRLRSVIAYGKGEEQPHFILRDGDCCPFLNETGLCDLITELGEDALCQICRDHPRFRSFWSERAEIGLGLACEEAARIVLGWKDPVGLAVIGEDPEHPEMPSQNERDLLELREDLFAILQDRRIPIDERMQCFLRYCGLEEKLPHRSSAESMEEFPDPQETVLPAGEDRLPAWAEISFEQFAVYLLFRNYADALYDGRLEDRLLFIARGYYAVRRDWEKSDRSFESLVELARVFSNTYEYNIETWGGFFSGEEEPSGTVG